MRWWPRVIVTAMLSGAIPLGACATGSGGIEDGGSSGRDASPGDAMVVGDAGRDGGRDASVVDSGPVDASMMVDSGGTDSGPADSGTPTCPPSTTNIAIVEVMITTESGTEDRGEWIELRNAGDCRIDLAGLEIASTSGAYVIPAGHFVDPGARFVLAQSSDPARNRGVPYDLVYDNIVLGNSSDTLELRIGGAAIDTVSWTSANVAQKFSNEFPDSRPISENGTMASWCRANTSEPYSSAPGGPYYGTPGMPNVCP